MSDDDLVRTFDVGANCPRFGAYVNDLRYELRDRRRPAPLFDDLYVLRPYTTAPQQWLRLRMVHQRSAIEVMIRMDNLYMVGFRQLRGGGRTWEFGSRPSGGGGRRWQGLIPDGSEPLGFDGGYTNDGIGDIQTAPPPGQQRRRDVGWQQLIDAIQGLATYEGRGNQPAAATLWLRTVIVTIIESIRSQRVCAFVASLVQEARSDWTTPELICIIRNWEKISECVILSANNPDIPELYRYLRLKGICGNTYEARQVVAILYRGPAHHGRREKRSASAPPVDDVPAGLSFVEVFAVVVLDIDCASTGDLCGTIAVDDGLDPEVLFRRHRTEPQSSVRPGGLAELTGPSRAIWGYDEVVFDLDLSHAASLCPDMSPDPQVSKGQMVWNAHQRPVEEYDRAQEHVLVGTHGAVKVCYAVVTNAAVATVVVQLSVTSGCHYTAMYGSITAATSAFPAQEMKLFNRDCRHAVTVMTGAAGGGQGGSSSSIRLLRNVLVVQLGSSLKINADIWDTAFIADMAPPDHQIAKGGAEFHAALAGTAFKTITGPHGQATVRVAWSRT